MATGIATAGRAALLTVGPCARNITIVCSTKPDLKNYNGGGIDIVVSSEERPLLASQSSPLSFSSRLYNAHYLGYAARHTVLHLVQD
jgi:hypothetical protein